jgi:hypothetical protein
MTLVTTTNRKGVFVKKYETTLRQLMQRGLKIPLLKEIYQWSDIHELAMTRREAQKLASAMCKHPGDTHTAAGFAIKRDYFRRMI